MDYTEKDLQRMKEHCHPEKCEMRKYLAERSKELDECKAGEGCEYSHFLSYVVRKLTLPKNFFEEDFSMD